MHDDITTACAKMRADLDHLHDDITALSAVVDLTTATVRFGLHGETVAPVIRHAAQRLMYTDATLTPSPAVQRTIEGALNLAAEVVPLH